MLTNKTQTETDTYYDDETNTGFAQAPQMMLLPYYFEWPREMVYISDAYSGFSEWVEDITKTNWILDTQDEDKITDRGEFVIDDPQQQEDNPVLIEGVQLPFHPGTFVYGTGDPSTGGFTFTNAYFVSLLGVDKLWRFLY